MLRLGAHGPCSVFGCAWFRGGFLVVIVASPSELQFLLIVFLIFPRIGCPVPRWDAHGRFPRPDFSHVELPVCRGTVPSIARPVLR